MMKNELFSLGSLLCHQLPEMDMVLRKALIAIDIFGLGCLGAGFRHH